MKDILKEISRLAIPEDRWNLLTDEQIMTEWLGNAPASTDEIKLAEDRLGVEFPDDYKAFLSIANGFAAANDIEPNFERVDQIDFLKNVEPFLIEIWSEEPLAETGIELAKSIVVAGLENEQFFLLVPPTANKTEWKYWKFANWIPGVESSVNLMAYFQGVLDFMRKDS